jgi:hypothetical protein
MLIKQEIERYLAAEQTAYKQLAKQHYQKKTTHRMTKIGL